jgi:hypothetical protein
LAKIKQIIPNFALNNSNLMFEATNIIYQNNDWITLVLLTVFVLLTFVKILFKDRLFNGGTFFLSKKYLSIYFSKEKTKILNSYQILLFFVQVLVLAVVGLYIYESFQLQSTFFEFTNFLLIVLGVALYFILHNFLGWLLAILFNYQIEFKKILFDKMNYFNNVILWLLPLVIFSVYVKDYKVLFWKITMFWLFLLLLLRYGLILKNNKSVVFNNLFYFILYLCALEIAPLIIVLKLTI